MFWSTESLAPTLSEMSFNPDCAAWIKTAFLSAA